MLQHFAVGVCVFFVCFVCVDAQQEEKSHLQERISTLEHDLAARNVRHSQHAISLLH